MSRSRHSTYRRPGQKLGYRRWRRRNAERDLPPRDLRRIDARERGWERRFDFVPLYGRPVPAPQRRTYYEHVLVAVTARGMLWKRVERVVWR